jgi:hypothetical protein
MKFEFSLRFSENYSSIKFNEKSVERESSCRYGQEGGGGRRKTDMTMLIVAFRNFANAPNEEYSVVAKIRAK